MHFYWHTLYYKTSWKEITVHILTSNFLSFCFEMYSDSNI